MTLRLEASYARAEQATAEWARSFYFASRFLPSPKRQAVFALYDYCRHADNLVDARGSKPKSQVLGELHQLGDTVEALHEGNRAAGGDRWLALGDTLARYPVPLRPLLDLLEGVATDLDDVAFEDWAALHCYCRLVAGGVGLMLGPVLGASGALGPRYREIGVGLGVAMQLTNVLRDLSEDHAVGRLYLPADEMRSFGVDRRMLEARRVSPEFVALMQFQVLRARALFDAADSVVGLFPRDGSRLTVRLLQRTYAGILDGIERLGYDVFRARAYVSGPRKLVILGQAMWAERPLLPSLPWARSA
ncbi:MAG: squalene/phytoene synthase family protein [Gemmatimonadales bacterium]|nr:squalene/phytoene synthase family protein [Gemmatimonadales bacterium]